MKLIFTILIILIIFIYTNKYSYYESFKNQRKNKIKKIKKPLKKIKFKKEELDDKVILITGSTRGIGYSLAKMLSNFKTKIVINGRNQENIDKVVNQLKKNNQNIIGIKADVSSEEDVDNLIKTTIKEYGQIDILVNNAAINLGSRDLSRKKFKDWKNELSVNIDAVFLLSQKMITYMRKNSIKGKIINVSSDSSKLNSTNSRSGTNILSKSFVEKMTNIMAEENYFYRIAVTTIRIDEFINTGIKNLMPFEIPTELSNVTKKFDSFTYLFASDPNKIIPVFLYVMRAPFHEISGKLISTKTYLDNSKLSKIVPNYNLTLDSRLYNNVKLTKSINHRLNKNVNYIVKQNNIGPTPRIKEIINKRKLKFDVINSNSRYQSVLDKIIGKKNNINPKKITFFRTEYEAMRKIIELFVPKYHEVITIYPSWSYLFLVCNEKKINMKYTVLKDIGNNKLQPNYYFITKFITARTKLIYLSSPNTTSGISMNEKDFKYLLDRVPDNIPIMIDQRFLDFSNKPNSFDPTKYLNKTVIILRSFNNFYGIQNLELAYTITSLDIAKLFKNSQIIDTPLDKFSEFLAMSVYQDQKYYNYIKNYHFNEKKRIYKILDNRNVKYIPSETNYFLIYTTKTKLECKKDLEKNNIILYESEDAWGSYWTLPITDKKTNNLVIDIITSYK
jgi:gluconate 5-dehydrogenase